MITREQAKNYYDKFSTMIARRNFTPIGLLNHLRKNYGDKWEIEPYLYSSRTCYISNEDIQITFFFKGDKCQIDRCVQVWDEDTETWIDETL